MRFLVFHQRIEYDIADSKSTMKAKVKKADDRIIGNRYRVVRRIGQGGMGAVFEAIDTATDRRVAVKLMRAKFAGDAKVAARFSQEAHLSTMIQHDNICEVMDVGEESDGTPYFVMPLLEGRTLADAIKDGPLPTAKAASIATRVLAALGAAHRNQVVHRDLTPRNIFLMETEDVRLLDFGISKILSQESTDVSHTGISIGTSFYMAPEQAAGKKVDFRADLYSVGVIMYEMLTGQRPFQDVSLAETMYKVTSKPPKPPRRINRSIPKAVEKIVLKAMAHDPKRRYSTAEEMLIDIERAVNLQHQSKPTNTIERTAEDIPAFWATSDLLKVYKERRPVTVYIIVAAFALLVVGAVVAILMTLV